MKDVDNLMQDLVQDRKEKREKLMESMSSPSVAVIFSGKAPMRSADEAYTFSVDRNFFYFTGIDRENMVLVMKKDASGKVAEELFIEPYDEFLAKWVGGRLKKDEAKELSGITSIYYIEELRERIHGFIRGERGNGRMQVGLDLWRYETDQEDTKAHGFAAWVRKSYPAADIVDMYDIFVRLRSVKSEAEISQMRKAQETTKEAMYELMRYAEPGMNEGEMEGRFEFALRKLAVRECAFPSIVAGGRRAAILHYRSNNQNVADGELVLLDMGSTYNNYCADISRTFPLNGKFTERQKELYNIVLEAQKRVTQAARPGTSLRELNEVVINYYKQALASVGLLKNGKTVEDYYYHGVSHHLGLDTHDISTKETMVLKPGMVITAEPGIYVEEEGIGIRIENDLLITEGEAEDLSSGIAREAEEIERIVQGLNN